MAFVVRQDMQRSNLMTQEIDHLFSDLNSSIDYCMKNVQQSGFSPPSTRRKQLRSQSSISESPSSASESSSSSATSPASESRGVVQHGFHQRYVALGGRVNRRRCGRRWARARTRWCTRASTRGTGSGTR